jgi:hypothetical protein
MANEPYDFEIIVQYEKSKLHPELVFDSISKLISSFQKLDSMSAKILGDELSLSFSLQSVESGSIKIKFLRLLKSVDDKDVEDLNWKRIAGKFINSCRKKVISMLDDPITPEIVSDAEMKMIQDAKNISGDKRIQTSFPQGEIIDTLKDFSEAINELSEGDSVYCIQGDDEIELKPSKSVFRFEDNNVSKTQIRDQRMVLKIKKADFLGHSKWEFKVDEGTVQAKITDVTWLEKFHKKIIKVGPGDALRVRWGYEYERMKDGTVIARDHEVVKVLEVISGDYQEQQDLFEH